MKYSVVLPVYAGDEPEWFSLSLESMLKQSVPSDDIIVVADGPLRPPLAQAVAQATRHHRQISFIPSPEHTGAGPTRNRGLLAARNPIVAVQDADDISEPLRMELSLAALHQNPDLVMVGGQMAEFANNDPNQITDHRKVPLSGPEFQKFAKSRMPVNGPTLVFRRDPVLELGGYGEGTRSEDYLLVCKLIAAGKLVENLPEVTLRYRNGPAAISRRRTWKHFREFTRTRLEIHRLGVASWMDVIIPCAAQLALTITPPAVTKWFYSKVLR